MAEQNYYKSAYTGEQIDASLGRIVSGELDAAVDEAQAAAQQAQKSAEAAENATVRSPYIGTGGNWMIWDRTSGAFTDSGIAARGPSGIQGLKGEKGDTGAQGPQGDKGSTGAVGPQGPKGDIGPIGPRGDKGNIGAQGPKGDVGEQGPVGPAGPQGPEGPQGAIVDLETGVFAMQVSEEGHLLVLVNDAQTAPPMAINEKGHLIYQITT